MRRLREVTLAGDPIPGFRPYRSSTITLEEVPMDELYPCALYVLLGHLEFQRKLRGRLSRRKVSIDPLHLREECALVEFHWKSQDSQVLTPPLIEVSEDDGNMMVVTDGLHRVTVGRDEGESRSRPSSSVMWRFRFPSFLYRGMKCAASAEFLKK
jgi:hypothetical protein